MRAPSDKQRLVSARQKARHFAVQALYQWKLGDDSWSNIVAQFISQYEMSPQSSEYFKTLVKGVMQHVDEIDLLLTPKMDLKINQMGAVEISILRMATFEMREFIDVPYRVVINEAVNLAKKFAATDSHKYINAVLDKIAIDLRPLETASKSR